MTCKHCGKTYEWTRPEEEMPRRSRLCPDCWLKPFPITSVCRADLCESIPPEDIAQLDDNDMTWLARKMANAYTETEFWVEIEVLTQVLLQDKQHEAQRG